MITQVVGKYTAYEQIREINICRNKINDYYKKEEKDYFITTMLRINWHDKTEITRPIQEATEQDVGKLCYFWDNDGTRTYGLLSDLIIEGSEDRKYGCCYGRRWTHARRLTKQEIEELC